MFHMLSAFSQFENELRKERQAEGIKKAINNGIKFGRPFKITPEVAQTIYDEAISDTPLPIKTILKKYEISRRTYYSIKNGNHPALKVN
ncbi:hypothetical protein L3V79_05605 [Thiotrichales bacterium 19S9-12]|nr:hypothetical protein [Thiotrichales bacterium 19S9-11]MCF6811835.1 hypothetical protein [Thiotrichales bacterium 19S9-12]